MLTALRLTVPADPVLDVRGRVQLSADDHRLGDERQQVASRWLLDLLAQTEDFLTRPGQEADSANRLAALLDGQRHEVPGVVADLAVIDRALRVQIPAEYGGSLAQDADRERMPLVERPVLDQSGDLWPGSQMPVDDAVNDVGSGGCFEFRHGICHVGPASAGTDMLCHVLLQRVGVG